MLSDHANASIARRRRARPRPTPNRPHGPVPIAPPDASLTFEFFQPAEGGASATASSLVRARRSLVTRDARAKPSSGAIAKRAPGKAPRRRHRRSASGAAFALDRRRADFDDQESSRKPTARGERSVDPSAAPSLSRRKRSAIGPGEELADQHSRET